jgi:preprotein translocase subunit SecE
MGIGDYIRETKGELRHISWPTRKQSINFTALVVGVSLFVAILLGIFDTTFDLGLREIILQGGFQNDTILENSGTNATTSDTSGITGEPIIETNSEENTSQ